MVTPRGFQATAIEELRDHIRSGVKRLLLCSGTGTGKTVIAALIVAGARQRNKRIVFLAHRKELITQTSRKLDAVGVDHGILQANHWRTKPWLPVQVASVATLINREVPNAPDLLIIDECHRAKAASYLEIIQRFPGAVLLGLTATPVRSDGKGLGTLFDVMVSCPSISWMIEQGYLVPIQSWTQPTADLKGLHKTAGDYAVDELAIRMNQSKLVGNIVCHWQRLGSGRQTVVFAVNIEHSKAIVQQFRSAGIRAEHLDGTTPPAERDAILARLENGTTQVVSNCDVLTEGWDCPIVSCVILARPTMSMGKFLQMAGRALRPHPESGKVDCLLLDHAGCIIAHGMVEEDREWQLTADRVLTRKSLSIADTVKVCPKCMRASAVGIQTCPGCGYAFSKSKQRSLKEEDGELVEAQAAVITEAQQQQRRRQYEFWLHQEEHGTTKAGVRFKRGYAQARYRGQYGRWPPGEWRKEWEARERGEMVSATSEAV